MEKLGVLLGCAGDRAAGSIKEGRSGNIVHVLAVPYPAQGHIVPLMQLCRKLASEAGLMITFVNTMHNHARMLQAEAAIDTYMGDGKHRAKHTATLKKAAGSLTSNGTATSSQPLNTNHRGICQKVDSNGVAAGFDSNPATKNDHFLTKNGSSCTESNAFPVVTAKNPYPHSLPELYNRAPQLDDDHCNPICNNSNNIRLVGIPGGLPPELHGDPAHVVAAFQASEALCDPLQKLIQKLNQEGPPVSCIVSDVLMSWTQDCADKAGVPRFAFWTSSATVYHVIWHMYGLISQGIPTFKEAAMAGFEDKNTEMVSCIPGLPPMDLNDLPIIVRSDPADFIYQFLARQLRPMDRAAAVLLNTFNELEEHCLQALPATCHAPIYSIGPLLPPQALQAASFDGKLNGGISSAGDLFEDENVFLEKYGPAAAKVKKEDCRYIAEKSAVSSNGGNSRFCSQFSGEKKEKNGGCSCWLANNEGESKSAEKGTSEAGKVMVRPERVQAQQRGGGESAPRGREGKGGGKAEKAGRKQGGGKAARGCNGGSPGIFNEDVSCLEWLDMKEPSSVLYISFGSIFAMSQEQFTELVEGLQASKQAFLWSIRPGFVQGCPNYTLSLPPLFLDAIAGRGLLVSWVPQLSVLTHPSIAGFLTHCGWNSTIESVAMGVPMLCWPDVGERRTNGRLAVSQWQAGLEFACSLRMSGLIISREEVKRVILLLMDHASPIASQLRARAAALQMSARHALSLSGSSTQAWNLFLYHIHGRSPS